MDTVCECGYIEEKESIKQFEKLVEKVNWSKLTKVFYLITIFIYFNLLTFLSARIIY